jgi:hypothetical protein
MHSGSIKPENQIKRKVMPNPGLFQNGNQAFILGLFDKLKI